MALMSCVPTGNSFKLEHVVPHHMDHLKKIIFNGFQASIRCWRTCAVTKLSGQVSRVVNSEITYIDKGATIGLTSKWVWVQTPCNNAQWQTLFQILFSVLCNRKSCCHIMPFKFSVYRLQCITKFQQVFESIKNLKGLLKTITGNTKFSWCWCSHIKPHVSA